jgi:hypothetical protein
LDPLVTSKSAEVCWYGSAFAKVVTDPVFPESAYTEAMIGDAALVPPKIFQPGVSPLGTVVV